MIDLKSKRIDLNMTPQEAFESLSGDIQNQGDYDGLQARTASFSNLAYPFVDCWDFKSALAFMIFDERGSSSHVERMTEEDQEKLGISKAMLLDAIYATGGDINHGGQYPINSEIIGKLRRVHGAEV
jgi:hypothetical protein